MNIEVEWAARTPQTKTDRERRKRNKTEKQITAYANQKKWYKYIAAAAAATTNSDNKKY